MTYRLYRGRINGLDVWDVYDGTDPETDPGNWTGRVRAAPDADGDGVADGDDPAPNDPAIPGPDSDGDGTPDAYDSAPDDPTVQ